MKYMPIPQIQISIKQILQIFGIKMYTSIQKAQIFKHKVTNLCKTLLSQYDLECITLFLTCSPHKQWKTFYLQYCHIQDLGLHVLHRNLTHSGVTIKVLDLSGNGLTKSSSSTISDLTIQCKVEVLEIITNHTIGEDPGLYNMLSHPSSRLVELYMYNTSLSTSSAIVLFNALKKGSKLQRLNVSYNDISDEACDTIITTMKNNNSLVELWMSYNKISAEAVQRLVQALQDNNALQQLVLPFSYPEDVKNRIRSLQEQVNTKRESRGCQAKLIITFE